MQRSVRFRGKIPSSIALTTRDVLVSSTRAVVLITAAWASFGCDSGSFIPPVNPELRGERGAAPVGVTDSTLLPTVTDNSPAPARPIEVILASHEPVELEFWQSAARMQAGLDRAKVKFSAVEAGRPPSTQAELVRAAIARNPRALVIEPADPADPELARAIDGAQASKIPVVLVGRQLTGPKSASPPHDPAAPKSNPSSEHSTATVVLEPKFDESAKQIVTATIGLIKDSDVDPKGAAAVLINTAGDSFIVDRETAINNALKAAGISKIFDVRFATDAKAGEKLLKETMKAHPEIVVVFALDAPSSIAAREVVSAADADRLMLSGCYTTEDQVNTVNRMPHIAAVAEFTPTRILRRGFTAAVGLTQGKEMPPVVDYRVNVTESQVTPAMLKSQYFGPAGSPGPKVKPPE